MKALATQKMWNPAVIALVEAAANYAIAVEAAKRNVKPNPALQESAEKAGNGLWAAALMLFADDADGFEIATFAH